MSRKLILILMLAAVFFSGFLAARLHKPQPSFHDMLVVHPGEISKLVTPGNPKVRTLARELQTPENAFVYVRDRIANDPALPSMPAAKILEEGKASCLGKAVLLCSLYRAMGIPSSEVRIVTGEVSCAEGVIDHAWIEMEHEGVCMQLDATDLLGNFAFDQFRGAAYTKAFIRKEGYTFNDTSFAIVSRLNQLKGTGHPTIR